MKTIIPLLLLFFTVCFGCKEMENEEYMEQWKSEIMEVEAAFNKMAQKEGLVKAFEYYAADDGVIKRGKKVVKGKTAIAAWYRKDVRPNESLTWKPSFIDVSKSGDLAYTYGDFVFTSRDSLGNKKTNTGIFHTVWKRQTNGSWRFVWD